MPPPPPPPPSSSPLSPPPSLPRQTPVIIGVGDVKNPSTNPNDALEPATLMLQAIELALADAGATTSASLLRAAIDSIDVVATWTWPYPDLPGLLAERLGVGKIKRGFYSTHGGNYPAKLLDEAARRVARGEVGLAVVVGGEALASLSACAAKGKLPPAGWTAPAKGVESVFSPTTRDLGDNIGSIHKIGAPIHVYPLYENARRAKRGQTIQENNAESAKLYADFARVAEGNPLAWNYGKKAATEQEIGTVTKRNRMICFPYPLLMNAFNTVNLAGACLVTSVEVAEKAGVPREKWIYPLGGAGTQDSNEFWERPNFFSSPSISRSLDAALEISGLTKDQIDLYDLYSCFPIVPKLACDHLGISSINPPKPLTLLGGLTSFGGAGNNYSMHALTEMTRQLRNGKGRYGLVLANGGVVTYQHVICLSSEPRPDGLVYPEQNPLPEFITDVPAPLIEVQPDGEAVVETYTVDFNRDGTPSQGHVVGLVKSSGRRFIANHGDESTLQQLAGSSTEPIGRAGWVRADPSKKGRNLFVFEQGGKL